MAAKDIDARYTPEQVREIVQSFCPVGFTAQMKGARTDAWEICSDASGNRVAEVYCTTSSNSPWRRWWVFGGDFVDGSGRTGTLRYSASRGFKQKSLRELLKEGQKFIRIETPLEVLDKRCDRDTARITQELEPLYIDADLGVAIEATLAGFVSTDPAANEHAHERTARLCANLNATLWGLIVEWAYAVERSRLTNEGE